MEAVMVVHNDSILFGRSIAGHFNFKGSLVALKHNAIAAKVADELPLLATGANDRKLVVNHDFNVESATNQQAGVNASAVSIVSQEAYLLKIGLNERMAEQGSDLGLPLAQLVAGFNDVFGCQPVGNGRASGDGLVYVIGGIKRAASAKQAFELGNHLASLDLIERWLKLIRKYL